jgi:hypothetical protein|tara:strand:+ start:148 stop:468 length:321 start_codon:yes stop_codon:yes gene_type:complete
LKYTEVFCLGSILVLGNVNGLGIVNGLIGTPGMGTKGPAGFTTNTGAPPLITVVGNGAPPIANGGYDAVALVLVITSIDAAEAIPPVNTGFGGVLIPLLQLLLSLS